MLPAVEVVGRGQAEAYYEAEASTATKTDAPLREVPQAVRVMSRLFDYHEAPWLVTARICRWSSPC